MPCAGTSPSGPAWIAGCGSSSWPSGARLRAEPGLFQDYLRRSRADRIGEALGSAALVLLALGLLAGATVFLFGWRRVLYGRVLPASVLGLLGLALVRRLAVSRAQGPWSRLLVSLARGCEMLLLAAGAWFLWSEAARVLFPGDR